MNEDIGPGLRKIQLAKTLNRLRVAAGLDYARVAEALGCARSRISHLESGRNVPHKPDLVVLAALYGVPERLDELVELWQAANEKGWWDTYRLPKWQQTLIGLESDAIRIQCWALELVPGLAQTEDYARDLLVHRHNPEGVERNVKLRMDRQKNLDRGQALTLLFSEALVLRTVHMGDVGRGQLSHLVRLANRYNVQVRVVPFTAGAHWAMAGGFTLMDFPPGLMPTVVYRQGAEQSDLTDGPDEVSKLGATFEENLAVSLDQGASVDLIKGVLETTGPGAGSR